MSSRPVYAESVVRDLIKGDLPWAQTKQIMSNYKDGDRFDKYIEILSAQTEWDDQILLPIGEHLFIVAKPEGRLVKCTCGHEFGDYQENWKLHALIKVRNTEESLDEIYPGNLKPDVDWMEIREFICPGCARLLEVEAVPPGYPLVHDFVPDLEGFYRGWLNRPVPSAT